MRSSPSLLVSLVSLFMLACGDSGSRGTAGASDSNSGTTSASAASATTPTTSGDAGTGSSGGSGATADESGTGPLKFDIGAGVTDGTTGIIEKGCTKADFLFVIDNSASMEDNQKALVASFPGFIAGIKATLNAGSNYHVMVVDSDDDGRCKQPCNLDDAQVIKFCAEANYTACEAKLDTCDVTRGAGVLYPVGLYASNKACEVSGGNRYMLPEEPDLEAAFACVATVGTAGNPSERPMNGMTEALSPALNGPGGCNDGFLREDAILVITFISDDPNYEDLGKPQEWYDAVVAAKGGNKEAIVVAGLIP
jgi:hypothetical protein